MKKNLIVLFVLSFLSICYSRQIQIPIPYENSPTTIELYNIKGQKILTKEFLRYDAAPISLSNNLANQIYIMRIKNGNRVFTRKFMPNHNIQFVGNFTNIGKISTNEKALFPEIPYQNLLRAEPLGDSVTNVIFINGMNNSMQKSEGNLDYIRTAYADKLKTKEYPGNYIFTLGYNESHNPIHDFSEVQYQWKTEFSKPLNALEWLAPIIGEEYYKEAMGISAGAANILNLNEIDDLFDRITESKTNSEYKNGKLSVEETHRETTNLLRKIMDKSFEDRQRVIIISHSQGNLFANELIDYYNRNNKEEEMKRTEVLNIAPPTVSPSKSWYFTNKDDAVINASRKLYNSKILRGYENWVISGNVPFNIEKHGFWEAYFHDNLGSRQLIDDVFFNHCKRLPFWEPIYHRDDVEQINKLIKENGLNLEPDKPESWGKTSVSWTDEETNKRVTRLSSRNILGDVSLDLPNLDSLDFRNGQIISLNLFECVEMTYLNVSSNKLTELSLIRNTALTYLNVSDNQLTELYLWNNRALKDLLVRNNQLDLLSIFNCTALTTLNANNNELTLLNVSNNTALTQLWVTNNFLTEFDASNNTALIHLGLDYNYWLASLKLPNTVQRLNVSCLGIIDQSVCPK